MCEVCGGNVCVWCIDVCVCDVNTCMCVCEVYIVDNKRKSEHHNVPIKS